MNAGPTEEGSAFACAAENGHQPGMSLRDYFAGQVITGLVANPKVTSRYDKHSAAAAIKMLVKTAFEAADAMLEAHKHENS